MNHPTHTLIVFLDGAMDEPLDSLGGRTPLESAKTPFMDAVAASGKTGYTDAKPYTHLFALELLGGRGLVVPRGVIEAVGHGIPISDEDVAYRLTPATIAGGRIHWEYQVSAQEEGLRRLARHHVKTLAGHQPTLHFYGVGKGILTLRSDEVQALPMPPEDANCDDFGDLGPYVEAVAKNDHGLGYLPWGGGKMTGDGERSPASAADGLVTFSRSPSVLGVSAYFGLETREIGAYPDGLREALSQLNTGNVLWHVEETDEASHRRDPTRKVEIIEHVDRLLLQNRDRLSGHRVAIIVDHGTSSITGRHIVCSVPFAVSDGWETSATERRLHEPENNHVPLGGLLARLVVE